MTKLRALDQLMHRSVATVNSVQELCYDYEYDDYKALCRNYRTLPATYCLIGCTNVLPIGSTLMIVWILSAT